jgi:hypothetical protein
MNKALSYLNAPVPTYGALAFAVGATAAGVAGTYFIMKRRNEATFQQRLDEEVSATKKFYGSLEKPSSPQEVLHIFEERKVTTIIEEEGYITAVDKDGDVIFEPDLEAGEYTEITHNVFTDATHLEWDLASEMERRDPDTPYVIEHDEFVLSDNSTQTLTYFEGDGVLADEQDEHIPDTDGVVGDENLLRFGHGSKDPNVVYVRNESIGVDFEIVRNPGKYTEQILGFIQHEDKRGARRFRYEDD